MILLIVNDEPIIADAMKIEIAWAKYGIDEVYVAYDVCSAKKIINSRNIDILLCDIEMPRENGLALLRWVRENKMEIECVILTCHAKFAYAQEAISLGCQDYILMPTTYEKIGDIIHNVVQRIIERKEEKMYIQYGKDALKEKMQKETESGSSVKIDPAQVLEEVVEYIMQNITENDLNVESVASYFHFHPVYLNRIFKKMKNTSIRQFIINERMRIAALLLREGNCSVNEVAEKVGYSHYTNFYNMFKKTYKMSPIQYVEKFVKNGNKQQEEKR